MKMKASSTLLHVFMHALSSAAADHIGFTGIDVMWKDCEVQVDSRGRHKHHTRMAPPTHVSAFAIASQLVAWLNFFYIGFDSHLGVRQPQHGSTMAGCKLQHILIALWH